jgi:hypothetical protein
MAMSRPLELRLMGLKKLLPGRGLKSDTAQQAQAFLEVLTIVVTRLFNKKMVLKHLVSQRLWEKALVSCGINGHEAGRLPNHFLKLGNDLSWRVVAGSGEDLLAKDLGFLSDCSNDVFT